MNEFRFEPNEDRIYVELDDLPDKIGNIYTPESQAAASRIGTVRAVGPGMLNVYGVPVPVKYVVGDRVLVSSYAGTGLYLIQYGMVNAKHGVYRESEIMGKIIE